MLEDLGAQMIDFDVLAREVVEPGKPAWKDIVAYFGEQVLNEDQSLDRKKLGDIVFKDFEKRKKLEGFTHASINAAFVSQVNEIAGKNPEAVIQAVIPLLIELNLQYQFHKNILVYVPPEVQVERLMKRDGITEEEANHRIKAQLPIDEKVGYADFVIHNDKSLEETQKQVEKLWEELRTVQKARGKTP
jgi:dephospho-CoA kinase